LGIISFFQLFDGPGEGISPCNIGFITEAVFGYSTSLMVFPVKPEISGRQQSSEWIAGSYSTMGTVNTSFLCRV
jgi:hypothetical protein